MSDLSHGKTETREMDTMCTKVKTKKTVGFFSPSHARHHVMHEGVYKL